MALKILFSLLSVVTLSFLFTTTVVSSRSLSNSPKTTVLDVVSSLQQTQHILSLHSTRSSLATNRPESNSDSDPVSLISSSPLSLQLHSRDTIVASHYKDYKSLVMTRLERDSFRVAGILAKVQNAVEGSDLKPVSNDPTRFQQEDLSTPVISGASRGIGEYLSPIGIGTPAKEMYMALDTGSDVNWIQCEPCFHCYNQSDPIFDPASSSTYKPLPCSAPRCKALQYSACHSNKCIYGGHYLDGSFTVGEFATETVTFGKSGKFDDFALGCGHDNEGDFIGTAGIIGLGAGPLSLTSQIKATSLSYCLVDHDSGDSSSLDFNSVQIGDGDATAPLIRRDMKPLYYLGLSGLSVGGEPVSIPEWLFKVDETGNRGVIMDSGTTVTRLQTQAYDSLRDAFVKLTTKFKRTTTNITLFDTCYDLSSSSLVDVPVVTLRFTGGKSHDLPAKNILVPVDGDGTFCFAFAPTNSNLSIIGNVQQARTRVTYDLANKLIGFSPNKC